MTLDMTTLRDDFSRDGFAIAPNLFARSEVQRLKLECIDILEAVKTDTGAVAGHGVYVGLAARTVEAVGTPCVSPSLSGTDAGQAMPCSPALDLARCNRELARGHAGRGP